MELDKLRGRSVAVLMPTYNDWLSIAHMLPLLDRIFEKLEMSCHIVIVDDGSTDRSGRELIAGQSLSAIRTIEEIALIRNHGNQKALAVGIGYVASTLSVDFLIVMDSDHEDRPDDIQRCSSSKCAQADGRDKSSLPSEASGRRASSSGHFISRIDAFSGRRRDAGFPWETSASYRLRCIQPIANICGVME